MDIDSAESSLLEGHSFVPTKGFSPGTGEFAFQKCAIPLMDARLPDFVIIQKSA
jgi:hypothetical protein